jgi:hypothetical protein
MWGPGAGGARAVSGKGWLQCSKQAALRGAPRSGSSSGTCQTPGTSAAGHAACMQRRRCCQRAQARRAGAGGGSAPSAVHLRRLPRRHAAWRSKSGAGPPAAFSALSRTRPEPARAVYMQPGEHASHLVGVLRFGWRAVREMVTINVDWKVKEHLNAPNRDREAGDLPQAHVPAAPGSFRRRGRASRGGHRDSGGWLQGINMWPGAVLNPDVPSVSSVQGTGRGQQSGRRHRGPFRAAGRLSAVQRSGKCRGARSVVARAKSAMG